MLVLDIETGPLPEDQLADLIPPFDREAVTHKSWGPEAIEKLRDKREAEHLEAFMSKAALNAETGTVIVVGLRLVDRGVSKLVHIDEATPTESDVLEATWNWLSKAVEQSHSIVTHNGIGFDLPFLVRRSFILGVSVPDWIHDGRYFHKAIRDTMRMWFLGERNQFIGLDRLAQILGCENRKLAGVDGADFHLLWKNDRSKATEYALADLVVTEEVATRMGVV